MENLITQIAVGIGGIGAGAWAMYQKVKSDNRSNKAADVTDAAWHQVIATLREEVDRMATRLAAVETQNQKCEQRNEELHKEILELKTKLHMI